MSLHSIIFLTQAGPTLPSVRFRVIPYIKAWQKTKLQISYLRIPKTFLKRIPFYLYLPAADIIILQKKLVSSIELKILRQKTKKLCFDFDDAIWTNHPSVLVTPKIQQKNARNQKRLKALVKNVDLVICGNAYLKRAVEQEAKETLILPTPIDTRKYQPKTLFKKKQKLIVGWIGTNTNLYFLEKIMPTILSLQDIQLKIISNQIPMVLPNEVVYEKWNASQEVKQVCSFDIGLMPLTDDAYTRGKCGFKILQYMACGVVPVASDVGFNREIITHGQDGFLVKNDNEWHHYIDILKNPHIRSQMALKARQKVLENFDITVCANLLLGQLKDLMAQA